MKLSDLAKYLKAKEVLGGEVEFHGVAADSRMVKKGDVFICCRGKKFDSHDFAQDAVKNGAAALVCERKLDIDIPQAIVENGRAATAAAARAFYGFADKKLKIVGVTGTNGKTTITYMLAEIFRANGSKAGVIGTLGISYGEKFIAPDLTTPDPIFLHSVLSDMAASGIEYVFMEVSAHALYFGKTDGIFFEVGVFTNCTQDHLDFFGNMEDYKNCKKKLFSKDVCRYCVINSDDGAGVEIMKSRGDAITYGIKNPADVFAIDITEKIDGVSYVLNLLDELYEIRLSMPAMHNVYNSMAAAACAKLLKVKTQVIAKGLRQLKNVPGRLERVARFNGADIFVDFAHTPDGLEKSLASLKKLCRGKLFCLFGCGGNRDRTKRPLMGEIAATYADFCIITSDNPRYEDPYDIISEIEKGVIKCNKDYVTVSRREAATEYAIRLLEEGDILLVAGKGGEKYQEIMGIKHSYDDNAVIKKIIGD